MSYTILQIGAAVGSLYVEEQFDQEAEDTVSKLWETGKC